MKVNLLLGNIIISKKERLFVNTNQFKNRILRFRFLANIELSPHF